MKPFLKWVGGKTKLLPELTARLPKSYGRYYEPFLGGGALFFHLAPSAATLSDTNPDLINCYQAVRDKKLAVIEILQQHRAEHSKAYYYAQRTQFNTRDLWPSAAWRAATFLYFNKTCFNGLWRVNRFGGFNVPLGAYKNPAILEVETLHAASAALQGSNLFCMSFEAAVASARAQDFVYCDPPYDPVSPTANFTGYGAAGFSANDQKNLALTYRDLAQRGCCVMLSNSDTPRIRSLYAGFKIEQVQCARSINSKASARGAVNEVIVTNY